MLKQNQQKGHLSAGKLFLTRTVNVLSVWCVPRSHLAGSFAKSTAQTITGTASIIIIIITIAAVEARVVADTTATGSDTSKWPCSLAVTGAAGHGGHGGHGGCQTGVAVS